MERFVVAAQALIRPAVAADEPALAALEAAATQYPWGEAQFRSACGEARGATGERAQLLENDGQLCAYVVYHHILDEAEILNIAVHPSCQRRGLALQLLQYLFTQWRESGSVSRCLLEVRDSNTPARALYLRMGFIEDGRRRNYYSAAEGREDAVLMSMQL